MVFYYFDLFQNNIYIYTLEVQNNIYIYVLNTYINNIYICINHNIKIPWNSVKQTVLTNSIINGIKLNFLKLLEEAITIDDLSGSVHNGP